MTDLSYYLRRIFFLAAFILAGLAVVEKIFNVFRSTLFGAQYPPWHLLELSAIVLLFVVVLQLREINISLAAKTIKEGPK